MDWIGTLKALYNNPSAAAFGSVCGTAIAKFFHVPVFYAILLLVAFDFITGVHKARILKKVRSSRLSDAPERIVNYLYLFVPLHAFSLIVPLPGFDMIDDAILGIFLTRELGSIIENVKVISLVRGTTYPLIDHIIDWAGIDLPKLLEEALPHPKSEDSHEKPEAPAA